MNHVPATRWLVREVHNFGGFFGGDTVTLTATPHPVGDETTITIDEKALTNVRDRHTVAPGLLFALQMTGDRVDVATVLGAQSWEPLLAAIGLGSPAPVLDAPLAYAYHCATCDFWLLGADDGVCAACNAALPTPHEPQP